MGLCNVSIYLDDNNDIIANIRNVHYVLYHDEFGQNFHCRWGTLSYLNPEDDIKLRTKNYFCKLDPNTLEVVSSTEIDTVPMAPVPDTPVIVGATVAPSALTCPVPDTPVGVTFLS